MVVTLKLVFIGAGLLSLACIAVTGTLLAFSTTKMTEDLVLSGGESQVNTAVAKIQTQMTQLKVMCGTFGGYFSRDLGYRNVSTPAQSVAAFNETFFNLSMQHLQNPGAQMGLVMTFLYPPGAGPRSQYNTMQALNDWGGVSQVNASEPGRLLTYTYTLPDGINNQAWMVNVSDWGTPTIVGESYQFSQREYYISMEGKDHYWDRIWPWIASDGTDYLFLTYQRSFVIDGTPFLVQSLQLMDQWYQYLRESLTDPSQSHLIVVDGGGQLVSSSVPSGLALNCTYVFNTTSFIQCNPLLASDSPIPLIQDMASMTSFLAPGATSAQGLHTLNGTAYFYVVQVLIDEGNLRLVVVWVRTRESLMGSILNAQVLILGLGCAISALTSLSVTLLAIYGLLWPLDHIVARMTRVRLLEAEAEAAWGPAQLSPILELRRLQTEFAAMMTTIVSFTKYIPKQLVRDMISSGTGLAKLGMRPYDITVLFCDIVHFQELCERLPTEAFAHLTQLYFTKISAVVSRHGGAIDKYVGDAIMCLWGAPLPCEEHQQRACCAALAMRAAVCYQLAPFIQQLGIDTFDIHVGIQTGVALCGNLGDSEQVCFTATGDTVNAVARIVTLNHSLQTSILITDAVHRAIARLFVCRYVGASRVGASKALTPLYTLHGLIENPAFHSGDWDGGDQSPAAVLFDLARLGAMCPPALAECADQYSIGLRLLQQGSTGEALEVFQDGLAMLAPLLAAEAAEAPISPTSKVTLSSDSFAIVTSDSIRKLPPRVSLRWLAGTLPQNLAERAAECQAHLQSHRA